MLASLFVCGLVIQLTSGYKTLELRSYTQLPTSINRGTYVYGGINLGTATEAAYDYVNNIVYVIGETSHFMHVIDIIDPSNPQYLLTHEFTRGEGIPLSIDVCGGEIAVALAAQTDVNEGHVRFYSTYVRNSGASDVSLHGYVTVGPHPNHVRYTDDCGTLIVADEGLAGKDEVGTYYNPEGSITIIHGERTGNPSVRMVDFRSYNLGQPNYNSNIRTPSLYIPSSTLTPQTTVAEDIEPENVVISRDGRTAWITLQENNAIAQLNINNGVIDRISPMPKKDWDEDAIDASDRDGGVHRRHYSGLQSLRQPGAMAILEIESKKFLFTGDEGSETSYTDALHGFVWSDAATARSLAGEIDPNFAFLLGNASDDEYLGRLRVSNIDGRNPFNQQFDHLEAFGGRGFSVWDTSNFASPVFDSEDTLELYAEDFKKEVFNTDYVANTASYQSPEITRDAASYRMGAAVTGIDIADDNGTVYLVVGTSSTGTLFLYTVDVTTGQPVPQFQSIVRSGVTDLPWRDLYTAETLGDLYISDLRIITSDLSPIDKPLVYVTSSGAGALSIYEIVDTTPIIPGPP